MSSNALRKAPAQERSRKRVALILEASKQILAEQGVNALTTNAIAAQAGIPVSSIYQYFPNKVAILSAIFEDYLASVQAAYDEFEAADLAKKPWKTRLRKLLEMLFQSEQYEGIELELMAAFYLLPELREIDERHAQISVDRILLILRSWGARSGDNDLRRVAEYFYHMVAAGWSQRLQQPERRDELTEFTYDASTGLLESYFN